jgi:polyketide biosynthesis enoyl-CoA hydratase PksI
MGDSIRTTLDEHEIAVVELNDVQNANSLSEAFINELLLVLDDLQRKGPKVLILQGLPEVFSAGASKEDLLALCEGKVAVRDLIVPERLLDLPFPTIAAMEGHAVGGGLVMGLCCDLVIAARESRYGASFLALGITPGMGCTALLSEMVGPFLAAEMMLTARFFRGSELAEKRTNINYIVSRSQVRLLARDLALQMADKNKEALWLLKNALVLRKKSLLVQARLQEDLMHRICFATPATRQTIEASYPER